MIWITFWKAKKQTLIQTKDLVYYLTALFSSLILYQNNFPHTLDHFPGLVVISRVHSMSLFSDPYYTWHHFLGLQTNEHMTLTFLSSILASSTNGYSCLSLLEERFWPRSLLLWGLLGVLEGKRLQSVLVPLPIQHTPEPQHFTHRPLHCQSPAFPGTL